MSTSFSGFGGPVRQPELTAQLLDSFAGERDPRLQAKK